LTDVPEENVYVLAIVGGGSAVQPHPALVLTSVEHLELIRIRSTFQLERAKRRFVLQISTNPINVELIRGDLGLRTAICANNAADTVQRICEQETIETIGYISAMAVIGERRKRVSPSPAAG
jgi:hypothetical protein